MPAQDSATVPIRDKIVYRPINTERSLEEDKINRTIEARLPSAIVGKIFDGKYITATLKTAVNREQSIIYHCYTHGVDIRARDFV